MMQLGILANSLGIKIGPTQDKGIQTEFSFLEQKTEASDGAKHIPKMNECIEHYNYLMHQIVSIRKNTSGSYDGLVQFTKLDDPEGEKRFKIYINTLYSFGCNFIWNTNYEVKERRSKETLQKNWKTLVSFALVIQRN